MKNIVLYDEKEVRDNLLPLTYTRPVSHIRVGINTISEKWQRAFGGDVNISYITPEYLSNKFPTKATRDNLFIASHILPTRQLADLIAELNMGEALCYNDAASGKKSVIAFRCSKDDYRKRNITPSVVVDFCPDQIRFVYDIFLKNGEQLLADFLAITEGRKS